MRNLLRHALAYFWMLAWGYWRYLGPGGCFGQRWAFLWGRRESPEPYCCVQCGYIAPLRWMVHGYEGCGDDEVEPHDECPKCGGDVMELP